MNNRQFEITPDAKDSEYYAKVSNDEKMRDILSTIFQNMADIIKADAPDTNYLIDMVYTNLRHYDVFSNDRAEAERARKVIRFMSDVIASQARIANMSNPNYFNNRPLSDITMDNIRREFDYDAAETLSVVIKACMDVLKKAHERGESINKYTWTQIIELVDTVTKWNLHDGKYIMDTREIRTKALRIRAEYYESHGENAPEL